MNNPMGFSKLQGISNETKALARLWIEKVACYIKKDRYKYI